MSTDMTARDDRTPMDSPDRCALTELIASQCAHCRVPPPQPMFADPFDVPSDDEDVIVAIFPARFGGRCCQCDGFIEPGDEISRTASGEYWCAECTQ